MEGENIVKVSIEDEMKSAYIDYSMSVIVSRALPDVRDGLKPVHRRVLYGMLDLGLSAGRAHKKSARIVGEVLGKYHPHGDSSVYYSMVRMAQDWSLRYPLVDGQGNFGSVDGDNPAAMRYTEARLRRLSDELLADLDKETVDFVNNFDDSLQEPSVLPTKIPNLLINGASGIAVGMATNMAPHNLTEVINGTIALIDDSEITIEGLMEHVKAPDFPTGGTIYGYEGVKSAFETGRGRIVMRANHRFEETKSGRDVIIVDEIPYQVNKADMIKKTADLINDKKIEGISDIRDESDRKGMRIVYELKRDAIPNVVLNTLFKYTALQTSFSVNNIALVHGRPMLLNLKEMIYEFVEHRHEVVVRRAEYELKKAKARAHILEGLLIAIDNLDAVIKLIRASANPEIAKDGLMETFALSELQAKAILDMRLQKLTGLERDKIRAEFDELLKTIEHLEAILGDKEMRKDIIRTELNEIKDKYGDERRTQIEYSGAEVSIEDLIADESVVVTISHLGYMKRTSLHEYRTQARGGVGSKGSTTRDTDFLEHLFVATNHDFLMIFTEKGQCYWMRIFEIPEGSKTSKGRAIQNLIGVESGDKIMSYLNVKDLRDQEYIENNFVVMCTAMGTVKKTSLKAYSRPRQNGIRAISIKEGDQLLEAKLTNGNNEIIIASKEGKAIRFPEAKTRAMGRTASGVRGIRLGSDTDRVIGMVCVEGEDENILVVSENGYGKRSRVDDYRITNRGGKGVKTISITEKTGNLIAIKQVMDEDQLMIINRSGIAIRLMVSEMRVMGRATQGVKLINLKGKDKIAAVAKISIAHIENDQNADLMDDPIPEDGLENGLENGSDKSPSNDSESDTSEEE